MSDTHTETDVLPNAKFSGSRSMILNMQGCSFLLVEPFLFWQSALYPALEVT
jgi:hypothetical protein